MKPIARKHQLLMVGALLLGGALACDVPSLLGPIVDGDIAEQRAVWTAKGIDDYVFTVSHSTSWVGPMKSIVSVKGGNVVGCRDFETNLPVNADDDWRCPTIDLIFDRAEARIAEGGWIVDLGFDGNLGIIRSMWVDKPEWADEEYLYLVHYFREQ